MNKDILIPYSDVFICDILEGHVEVPWEVTEMVQELTDHTDSSEWIHMKVGTLL